MAARRDRILVAGAGIAGLSSALCFAGRGFDVAVFERAPAFEEIGAGLQLSPNATRILRDMGLLEALRAIAVEPDAVVLRSASTLAEIARIPLGRFAEERWDAPYLTLHRADLHRILLEAARASERIALHAGAPVRGFSSDGGRPALAFDGTRH